MTFVHLFPVAGILTLACAYLLWAEVWQTPAPRAGRERFISLMLGAALFLELAGLFHLGPISVSGLDFELTTAVAIVTLLVQVIYLVGLWQHGVHGLGLLLLPATAAPLLVLPWLPATAVHTIRTTSLLETGHLLISMLAYAILTLAFLLALMQLYLDRALKRKRLTPMMQVMPSLIEIETHMYAQIRWTVWLLGLGILTGLVWQWEELAGFALLSHKVLLALFSWAVLVALLALRRRSAWHSRRASHMVIAAYVLLLLAYFGVKLIRTWVE